MMIEPSIDKLLDKTNNNRYVLCTLIAKRAKELGLENTEAVKTRVEEMKGSFDYVVSRAVTELSLFYPWVKDKYKKSILYLKGGDIAVEVELAAHKCKIRRELIEVTDISRFFKDEYFTGKRIVEIKRWNQIIFENKNENTTFALPKREIIKLS